MTRTSYYTASTLDGFIATDDHSLDWLLSRDIDQSGPMNYDDFRARLGAGAMGASTYEWIIDHENGAWSYTLPMWVFTHRNLTAPAGADVRFTSAPVPEVHAEMVEAAAGKDIWVVGGGDLVGQFHDHGLLDEVMVQYAPVTVGSGKPLLPRHVELELREVARNREFACARYDVKR
ncbi:dihydrofolate reductase family protein [Propionibacteriaceae bacterium Y2011]|uniref:dihydrofolate reductase family protein n=1 Tax=Microlunatus sp. Y2014 TaxID=3418488 RepID=UPI003B4A2391